MSKGLGQVEQSVLLALAVHHQKYWDHEHESYRWVGAMWVTSQVFATPHPTKSQQSSVRRALKTLWAAGRIYKRYNSWSCERQEWLIHKLGTTCGTLEWARDTGRIKNDPLSRETEQSMVEEIAAMQAELGLSVAYPQNEKARLPPHTVELIAATRTD